MPAEYKWYLCGGYGQILTELTTAAGKQLSYARNTYAEARAVVSVDDEAAWLIGNELRTGWPRLRVYRHTETANQASLIFNGHLAPILAQAEEGSTLQIVARSPFARLGDGPGTGRPLPALTYSATDAGAVAFDILANVNASSPTGLAPGNIVNATKTRDITYPVGTVAGEAIIRLSQVQDGFDFSERFVHTELQMPGVPTSPEATMAYLDIYARLGSDQPNARFEYGKNTLLSNVRSASEIVSQPINRVVLTGANGIVSDVSDANSIATYGQYPLIRSFPSISIQATLDDRAYSLLRSKPVVTVQMVPESSAPKPWDTFYVGDTGYLLIDRGFMQVNTAVRINAFTVNIDENGLESSEIQDPLTPDEEATLRASLEVEVVQA